MAVTLSKIVSNSATVTFKYGEDEVNVEYYPARITEGTFAQLQAFSKIEDFDDTMNAFISLNELLAGKPAIAKMVSVTPEALKARPELAELTEEKLPIIKSWDVLEDDGSMFPIKASRFPQLPIAFRLTVLKAIMQDIRPNDIAPTTTLN